MTVSDIRNFRSNPYNWFLKSRLFNTYDFIKPSPFNRMEGELVRSCFAYFFRDHSPQWNIVNGVVDQALDEGEKLGY